MTKTHKTVVKMTAPRLLMSVEKCTSRVYFQRSYLDILPIFPILTLFCCSDMTSNNRFMIQIQMFQMLPIISPIFEKKKLQFSWNKKLLRLRIQNVSQKQTRHIMYQSQQTFMAITHVTRHHNMYYDGQGRQKRQHGPLRPENARRRAAPLC